MHDLDPVPGGPNSVAPGKMPLSSMSPTIVLKQGKPFLAVGSPGSTRIISAVAQVLSNVLDHGMGIQEAIDASRVHSEGDVLHVEGRVAAGVQEALQAKGYRLDIRKDVDYFFGGAHGVLLDGQTGEFHGGADPRRDGLAVGVQSKDSE
jgi:gamma-glutamyltranspeptidase/glutathione hydrolase